jgi:hypothetical protein
VFCERYKKEKLFEREKKEAVRILMHLWTAKIGVYA